jgi:hypothetical protein
MVVYNLKTYIQAFGLRERTTKTYPLNNSRLSSLVRNSPDTRGFARV